MQSVSSRIWTRVAVSISYDDNHYTTGTSNIFTEPSAQAGYDTRSIFKRSLTGLNSEFSFSKTSCLTKTEEPSLPNYLPIAEEGHIGRNVVCITILKNAVRNPDGLINNNHKVVFLSASKFFFCFFFYLYLCCHCSNFLLYDLSWLFLIYFFDASTQSSTLASSPSPFLGTCSLCHF